MATNFPSNLDDFSNPQSTDSLAGHAELHSNVNDAIEALQSKVGVNDSQDPNSLDYRIDALENSGAGTVAEELGLAGNNDLTITGIENQTAIDTFSATEYRTVRYELQISRSNEYHSSTILVLNDGTNINIVESNVISNTENNLANVTFGENSGIISLYVTPVSTAVTARYVRTALKA